MYRRYLSSKSIRRFGPVNSYIRPLLQNLPSHSVTLMAHEKISLENFKDTFGAQIGLCSRSHLASISRTDR